MARRVERRSSFGLCVLPALMTAVALAVAVPAFCQNGVDSTYRGQMATGVAADGRTLAIVMDTDTDGREDIAFLLGVVDESAVRFPDLGAGTATLTARREFPGTEYPAFRLVVDTGTRTLTFESRSSRSSTEPGSGVIRVGALATYWGANRRLEEAVATYLTDVYRPIARAPGR